MRNPDDLARAARRLLQARQDLDRARAGYEAFRMADEERELYERALREYGQAFNRLSFVVGQYEGHPGIPPEPTLADLVRAFLAKYDLAIQQVLGGRYDGSTYHVELKALRDAVQPLTPEEGTPPCT